MREILKEEKSYRPILSKLSLILHISLISISFDRSGRICHNLLENPHYENSSNFLLPSFAFGHYYTVRWYIGNIFNANDSNIGYIF